MVASAARRRAWVYAVAMVSLVACGEPPRAPRWRPTAEALDPWPEVGEVLALRRLLAAGDFAGLDSAYAEFAVGIDTSFVRERRFARALRAFAIDDPVTTDALGAWIRAARDPRHAHAVRVEHLQYRAFAARGARVSDETPRVQLDAFARILVETAPDIEAMVSADSTYLPAYWAALALARASGDTIATWRVLDRALAQHPGSYETYAAGLDALRPRWGGSLGAMYRLVDRAVQDTARNRYFMLLGAFPHAELAYVALVDHDTAAAFDAVDAALELGPEPRFCLWRAQVLMVADLVAEAARDYACGRKLTNLTAEDLAHRAYLNATLALSANGDQWNGKVAAAAALADSALLLDPRDSSARALVGALRDMAPQ